VIAVRDPDRDGDVDQSDFTHFRGCLSGANVPAEAGCEGADLDSDSDVDQSDFGIFQKCISGNGDFADPNCED
jgi:hypothetical protein